MDWKFDQAPNMACLTCRGVMDGNPVLVVTHYGDDESWCFMDGSAPDAATAMIVGMSEMVSMHPDVEEIADLPPGWSAMRAAFGQPWERQPEES